MQIARFSNGGFAVHKVLLGTRKASAWFDKDGKLIDHEVLNANGRRSPVINADAMARLAAIGRAWVNK